MRGDRFGLLSLFLLITIEGLNAFNFMKDLEFKYADWDRTRKFLYFKGKQMNAFVYRISAVSTISLFFHEYEEVEECVNYIKQNLSVIQQQEGFMSTGPHPQYYIQFRVSEEIPERK